MSRYQAMDRFTSRTVSATWSSPFTANIGVDLLRLAQSSDRRNCPRGAKSTPWDSFVCHWIASLIHPADARIPAHPAGAGRPLGSRRRGAIRMRRKRGVLLAHILLPAGGTTHIRHFRRAADQLLKPGIAILTLVFVDRHSLFRYQHTYFIKNRPHFGGRGVLIVGQEGKSQ